MAAGTTQAALCSHLPHLRSGDVLIFERTAPPGGDSREEVDPRERQAVRLCRPPVLGSDLADADEVQPITEIEWLAEDALKADFPVSERRDGVLAPNLTVVRGNLVLADHGSHETEVLEPVPVEGHYSPQLTRKGLTHRIPFDPEEMALEPAAAALSQDPRRALPDLELYELAPEDVGDGSGIPTDEIRRSSRLAWTPRHNLLSSRR